MSRIPPDSSMNGLRVCLASSLMAAGISEPEKHRLALARKISRTAGVNPFDLHPAGLELTHRMIEMQREIAPTQTLNFNPTPGR